MGTASKLKKIRKIAEKLPTLERYSKEISIVLGSELIKEYECGHFPNGDKILPEVRYRVEVPLISEVNHIRRMKKYFKMYGILGVKAYSQSVINYNAKQNIANVPQ